MIYSAAYLASMVLVNVGFAYVPLIHGWPPMSLAVGLVFVLRDFAQREIGHRVILLMLAGAVLSYFMASPAIALASCAARVTAAMDSGDPSTPTTTRGVLILDSSDRGSRRRERRRCSPASAWCRQRAGSSGTGTRSPTG